MDAHIRAAYDAARDFQGKALRAACYAPFVSVYFNTVGDVLACCKNQTFVLGNVARERFDDIWRGARIGVLRQALADYRFEAGCEFCEWQIAGGDHRGAYPWIFEELPVDGAAPEWPAMIEFAGSNTCNFECIMCSGVLSSSIRANREGLPPLAKVYSDRFFDDLRPYLAHLRRAKFLGGEPFLARECFRIWDMMIADGLAVPCHVTTNGSQWNARVERVLEALPVSLSISVDGATKETVERVRVHARFERVMENVRRFRDYAARRRTWLGLTYCLMRQNWHEFGAFLLLAEELGCEVYVNTVVDPPHCSLYTLPPDELARIADRLEAESGRLAGQLRLNRRVWDEHVQNVRNNANQAQAEKLAHAKQAALEAWRDGPDGVRHHVTAAAKLLGERRYAEALAEAGKVPPTHPHFYHAVVLCGHVRHLQGDLDGAGRDFDRAVALSRKRPEGFVGRARVRVELGRLDEALADATAAQALAAGNRELDAGVCEVLAAVYTRQGRHDEARAALDRLGRLPLGDAGMRVHRGLAFRLAGLHQQALVEVQAALAIDPDNGEASRLAGELGGDAA